MHTSLVPGQKDRLLSHYFKDDQLFLIGLYFFPILDSRDPGAAPADDPHSLFAQAILVGAADSLNIADIAFLVDSELYHNNTLYFIAQSYIGISKIFIEITQPCGRAAIAIMPVRRRLLYGTDKLLKKKTQVENGVTTEYTFTGS